MSLNNWRQWSFDPRRKREIIGRSRLRHDKADLSSRVTVAKMSILEEYGGPICRYWKNGGEMAGLLVAKGEKVLMSVTVRVRILYVCVCFHLFRGGSRTEVRATASVI